MIAQPVAERCSAGEVVPWRVLLVGTTELRWAVLRTALEQFPDVRVIGEAWHVDEACAAATAAQPDVIVSAVAVAGRPDLALVAALGAGCPQSALIVIAPTFTPEDVQALAGLGVTGYLLWHDLETTTLRHCLAAVGSGRVMVGSRVYAAPVAAPLAPGAVSLTERERAVLAGLAAGQTRPQVAQATGLGLRTVERVLADLEVKLDAPSPFVLGLKAAQLGVVGWPPTAHRVAAAPLPTPCACPQLRMLVPPTDARSGRGSAATSRTGPSRTGSGQRLAADYCAAGRA